MKPQFGWSSSPTGSRMSVSGHASRGDWMGMLRRRKPVTAAGRALQRILRRCLKRLNSPIAVTALYNSSRA